MMNRTFFVLILNIVSWVSLSHAATRSNGRGHGTFGANIGASVPYVSELGLNLYFTDNIGLDVDYGMLKLIDGIAVGSYSMSSALLKWHPFSGSFYLAAGAANIYGFVSATNVASGAHLEARVSAFGPIGKVGWMWGASEGGGLWFGMDVSYVVPANPVVEITGNLTSNQQGY